MDAEREFKSKATQMLTTVTVGTEASIDSSTLVYNQLPLIVTVFLSTFALIEITSFNISFLNSPFVTLSKL